MLFFNNSGGHAAQNAKTYQDILDIEYTGLAPQQLKFSKRRIIMFLTMILLVLIGLLSAVLGSLVGIGGGIIIVPTLVYLGVNHHLLHGITTQIAIGTSSVILIVTGLSSSIGYLKTKQVDIKNGSIFLFGLLPGSLIGSF